METQIILKIIQTEPPNMFIPSVPFFIFSRVLDTHAEMTIAISKLMDMADDETRQFIQHIDPQYYTCPRAIANIAEMVGMDTKFVKEARSIEPVHMIAYVDNSLPRAIYECQDYCAHISRLCTQFISYADSAAA
jgi:hypothetical protein